MSELKYQNYVTGSRTALSIPDLNDVTMTVTSWNLPGITTGAPRQPTPFTDIPHRGDKLVYEQLVVEFIVTERLENLLQIHDWMTGFTAPQAPSQWRNKKYVYLDGTITLFTSHNNKILVVKFNSLVPVNLSSIPFETTDNETQYIKATATFEYESYEIIHET